MADKLTPQQAQAVNHRGSRLLVSAAAGSGKTKVLVDRLLSYLTDPTDPADINEFLIITYTKAAASELRGKIAAKLTERIALEPENRHLQRQIQRLFLTKISTVHGFCGDILREYAYKLDLSGDFRVADENECAEMRQKAVTELLDRAYETAHEDPDFCSFLDTQGLGRDDRLAAEIILKVYDSARCHLNPELWMDNCLRTSDVRDLFDVSQTIWGTYLLQSMKQDISYHIQALEACADHASRAEGYEKVVENLRSTLSQLYQLRDSNSWDEVVRQKNIDFGRLTFPRKAPDMSLVDPIREVRNSCKDALVKKFQIYADPSEIVLRDLAECAAGIRGIIRLVRQFDLDYTQLKRSRRVLDFSDLEHKALDLLLGKSRSGPTAAAAEIGDRFREILVDEYQDSNGVQDAIFSVLTEKRENCFMVGDVKQSIYQFRLADPGIFLEKYITYQPVGEESIVGNKVLLSHNFRSGGEVVEAVNAVFSHCMRPRVGGLFYGEDEMLREGIPHSSMPDSPVELHAVQVNSDSYLEEAEFTANRIREMLENGTLIRKGDGFTPVTPDDIVILLRSPGSVGSYFQQALERIGIRCNAGGGTDLLQTDEVSALYNLLQTIHNPRLDIPLVATLTSPVFGFTADELAAFRSRHKKGSVYDSLLADDTRKTRLFLDILRNLRWEARMNSVTELLKQCFCLTQIDSIYGSMPGGEAKQANLQTFYGLAVAFEGSGRKDLGQFLDHVTALQEKGLISPSNSVSGCVNIMSIHKSKGLEFPVVFLCGLSRSFNREGLRAQILCDKDLGLGLSIADSKHRIRYPSIAKRAIAAKMESDSLSEEMRVLYVAMTRAKDRLIMTYASKHLDTELANLAYRMRMNCDELICSDVSCPGEWVLYTAMKRTEAGALFGACGVYPPASVSEIPWKITVSAVPILQKTETDPQSVEKKLPSQALEAIRSGLSYQYDYIPATKAPSKQTATGRKGRWKDEEAWENATDPAPIPAGSRYTFQGRKKKGIDYGTAQHALMQYIQYDRCRDVAGVRQEIQRLQEQGFLSQEQADLADAEKIAAFFATDMGKKLVSGVDHVREFKFSILDEGSHYGEGLAGERVLLQGVVDCALLEADGITVVDFKTDYVTDDTLEQVTERYRIQVQTYGEALARIFEMPVRRQLLYFFRLNRFVEV